MADDTDLSLANAPGSMAPTGGKGVAAVFDPRRFDHLSESEVLRRIGALLATAIVRSCCLRARPVAAGSEVKAKEAPPVDSLRLISNPLQRQIAEYLHHTGPASPSELCRALDLRSRSLGRSLARLRADGLCEVVGKTKAARYRLRSDFGQN